MAENKGEKKEHKEKTGWDTLVSILQTFVPALSVFAALGYFLGRLYIEYYYYALGISPNVLTFTTNDYMFSSFNLVIMCLVFSVLFYICWEWFITAEKTGRMLPAEIIKRQVMILSILIVIFFACATYYIVFIAWPKAYFTGISGLITGLGLGILIVVIIIIINPKTEKTGKGSIILLLLTCVIILFSLMPMVTNNLARAQADSDLKKFPIVEVITKETLPAQLQDGSTSWTDSVAGRLILINEKTIYLSKLRVRTGNVTANLAAVVPEEKPSSLISRNVIRCITWKQVYAIPTDSIKDIIYYSKEEWFEKDNSGHEK